LKQDVRTIKQTVVVLEKKLHKDFELIKEGLIGWNERNRQIDRLEAEYEEHDHRIWALEQVARK
jgi:hypothetical protein